MRLNERQCSYGNEKSEYFRKTTDNDLSKIFTKLGFDTEAECMVRGNELVIRPAKTNTGGKRMTEVRFFPPAAKYIKKLKGKKLKRLYQEAIDKIREDHTVGEAKTGDLSGLYGYEIYDNKNNYELAYTVEYLEGTFVVIIMAGTRGNFYDQLKQYNLAHFLGFQE